MGLIKELIKGLRVTGGTMVRTIAGGGLVTTEYPKEMRVKPQRFHGRHVLNRYPDGSGFYLRQALAKKHGVSQDQIVLGNGSNELIELLVRAFLRPGDEAIVPHPSFVVYPMIVQAAGGVRVMVMLKDYRLDLEAMARALTPLTKLVFIANPNNPTATIVTAEEVEHFMARVPERTIVVFDEAYVEFAQGRDFPDSLGYLRQGRRVIILRTFSKVARSGPCADMQLWIETPPGMNPSAFAS